MSKLPDDINPGIMRTCRWINSLKSRPQDYRIVDSGDGETHLYGCDREEPYVVILLETSGLAQACDVLKEYIESLGIEVSEVGRGEVWVEGNYDPVNGLQFINVTGLCDRMLPEGVGNE